LGWDAVVEDCFWSIVEFAFEAGKIEEAVPRQV
jgi:hypothetical protein